MNLPDFLTLWPNDEIVLTGHRIGLYSVVQTYKEGHTAEMLHHDYPSLPLALIYKLLAFYWENKDDVDLYVTGYEAELDHKEAAYEPTPGHVRIRQMMSEKAAVAKAERKASIASSRDLSLNLPEFLTRHEKGEIRLTGHRIDLFHFVEFYNEGNCAEMLLSLFPTLNLALIHKVLAFYLENAAGVDAYIAHCKAEGERQQAAASPAPTIEQLRARRQARAPVPTA